MIDRPRRDHLPALIDTIVPRRCRRRIVPAVDVSGRIASIQTARAVARACDSPDISSPRPPRIT